VSAIDRLRGCLLGGALGDAIGAAHEGMSQPSRPIEIGATTDDTQLTLAACEALVRGGGRVLPDLFAQVMLERYRAGSFSGLGAATLGALRALAVGGHWALVGRRGEHAAGNGAAVRVAPLAFVIDPRSSRGRGSVRDVSRITHHSDEAYAGALAVCIAVHDAAHDRLAATETWWSSLLEALPDTALRDRLEALSGVEPTLDALAAFGTSGHVVDSVPLAIAGAVRCALPFHALLEGIVKLGGDTDSNAAIAGQIRGARDGLSVLPDAWLQRLVERPAIEDAVQHLRPFVAH
jgi:ADP-ribosylglycohydrolase